MGGQLNQSQAPGNLSRPEHLRGADKFWVVLRPIPIDLEEDQGDK